MYLILGLVGTSIQWNHKNYITRQVQCQIRPIGDVSYFSVASGRHTSGRVFLYLISYLRTHCIQHVQCSLYTMCRYCMVQNVPCIAEKMFIFWMDVIKGIF
jgi:hypothetical protein